MKDIYLLQNYKNYVNGNIINVSDVEANILVKDNIARIATTKD